jgi:hypothetical protein
MTLDSGLRRNDEPFVSSSLSKSLPRTTKELFRMIRGKIGMDFSS